MNTTLLTAGETLQVTLLGKNGSTLTAPPANLTYHQVLTRPEHALFHKAAISLSDSLNSSIHSQVFIRAGTVTIVVKINNLPV